MSFQLLDLILIGIMLISGLLALMRGFTREVLSLVSWGGAALAAYLAIKQQGLVDLALPYVGKPALAQAVVGGVVFFVALIIISLISVKISDAVVDSAVGAFDRSLGLIFGLARGFLLVTICYLFYGWLLKEDQQEPWVRNAASLPYIKSAGEFLIGFVPADIAETLSNTALIKNPAKPAAAGDAAQPEGGVQSGDQQGLDNLIEGTGNGTANGQKPIFGQGEQQ
jgi:membrane protein required for colicin V production